MAGMSKHIDSDLLKTDLVGLVSDGVLSSLQLQSVYRLIDDMDDFSEIDQDIRYREGYAAGMATASNNPEINSMLFGILLNIFRNFDFENNKFQLKQCLCDNISKEEK